MEHPSQAGVLFTDLYELTMAQVYFSHGMADHRASFEHHFRTYPAYGEHRAGFCISAGLGPLLDRLAEFRFGDAELSAMSAMRSASQTPLFEGGFLNWLERRGDFGRLTIRAVPDGRVVHPHTPMTVVEGPLALGQIVESVLLNHRNFATLVATKAARVKQAARSGTVLEFGMRRSAGIGANLAAEAALVGGADFSSNVAASLRLGLPARGTHAHSMVQAFMALGGSELDSFRAFAQVYPDDCVLLVDTIDTMESGMPNAITVFEELRRRGHRPVGVRLDSGDPAPSALEAARMLDEAGFEDASIVLSDQLDEVSITRITAELGRRAEEPDRLIARLVFGVGTRLVTSHGAPSLDGVYKLAAIRGEGTWKPAYKTTDDPAKSALPGRKGLWRRYGGDGTARQDLVTLVEGEEDRAVSADGEQMLETVWTECGASGDYGIESARTRRRQDLSRLSAAHRDLLDPARYPVVRSRALERLWKQMAQSPANAGPAHD